MTTPLTKGDRVRYTVMYGDGLGSGMAHIVHRPHYGRITSLSEHPRRGTVARIAVEDPQPGSAKYVERAVKDIVRIPADPELAAALRTIELLNAYGAAKFGDEWWPGNASEWIPDGHELELRLEDGRYMTDESAHIAGHATRIQALRGTDPALAEDLRIIAKWSDPDPAAPRRY